MSQMLSRRVLIGSAAAAALPAPTQRWIYWGTYTAGGPRYGTGESQGIYVSRFEPSSGKLGAPELAAKTANPSYLAVHPNRKYLYSVNEHIEMDGKTPGELTAFAIDPATGKLTELNRGPSGGGMPCHIAVDRAGKVLATANWATGSAALFKLRRDGRIGEAAGHYQHTAADPAIQVHCHAVVFSPDDKFLIETDTGLNSIFVHRRDGRPDAPALKLVNKANPRHLVFHPNGKWAYVANEAGPGCTALRYDAKSGVFAEIGVTRTVPSGFTGRVTPAEAVMHPSGRYVLISNRGHESIAVLDVHPVSGVTRLIEAFQPGGAGARSFNVDPSGKWVFALMQRTNQIFPLRFDVSSGKLSREGEPIALPAPVCAKFV